MPARFARLFLTLLMGGAVAGCASHQAPCPPAQGDAATTQVGLPDWHEVITDPDHVRLRAWRDALVEGLAAARTDGHGAEIDKEGDWLDPDVAMDDVALPIGLYDCSVVKLGSKDAGHTSFIHYPTHHCEVRHSDTLTRLVELDGLQRPSGRLYPDMESRMVFLGTMILGDETKPIGYGRDADRDMVGALQRIGDGRWRILFPHPAWESQMDVLELTPSH